MKLSVVVDGNASRRLVFTMAAQVAICLVKRMWFFLLTSALNTIRCSTTILITVIEKIPKLMSFSNIPCHVGPEKDINAWARVTRDAQRSTKAIRSK